MRDCEKVERKSVERYERFERKHQTSLPQLTLFNFLYYSLQASVFTQAILTSPYWNPSCSSLLGLSSCVQLDTRPPYLALQKSLCMPVYPFLCNTILIINVPDQFLTHLNLSSLSSPFQPSFRWRYICGDTSGDRIFQNRNAEFMNSSGSLHHV